MEEGRPSRVRKQVEEAAPAPKMKKPRPSRSSDPSIAAATNAANAERFAASKVANIKIIAANAQHCTGIVVPRGSVPQFSLYRDAHDLSIHRPTTYIMSDIADQPLNTNGIIISAANSRVVETNIRDGSDPRILQEQLPVLGFTSMKQPEGTTTSFQLRVLVQSLACAHSRLLHQNQAQRGEDPPLHLNFLLVAPANGAPPPVACLACRDLAYNIQRVVLSVEELSRELAALQQVASLKSELADVKHDLEKTQREEEEEEEEDESRGDDDETMMTTMMMLRDEKWQ